MFAQTDKCFGNQTSNPSHSVSQPSLKLKLFSLHLNLRQEKKHVINVQTKDLPPGLGPFYAPMGDKHKCVDRYGLKKGHGCDYA